MARTDFTTQPFVLRSVYNEGDFSESEFQAELDRVHAETAIERLWMAEAGLPTYADDFEILEAAAEGRLVDISRGMGHIAIDKLTMWDITHAAIDHEHHYSPPYMLTLAAKELDALGADYQDHIGSSRYMSLTSAIRSNFYQHESLAKRARKLTSTQPGLLSSHQAGLAFDLDANGLVEVRDDGGIVKINPRYPEYRPRLAADSQAVIRELLYERKSAGRLNFVEELPGAQEHVFHVCVNPLV